MSSSSSSASLSRNKELRIFEALETLTKHESFDSSASFVRRFVGCDLDLNNTHQSIPEEEEEEEEEENVSQLEAVGSGGSPLPSIVILDDEEEEEEEEEDDDDDDQVDKENIASVGGGYGSKQLVRGGANLLSDSFESLSAGEEGGNMSDDEINDVLEVIRKKHGMEYVLLAEMKRSVELQESILAREKEVFAELQSSEQSKLVAEKRKVENQRKNLQSLITDYHKIKGTKEEYEGKIKDLTEKLRETKLEMNKRISRWGDQQKKLEERVKALERENENLKKVKPMASRVAALKRPPMLNKPAVGQPTKPPPSTRKPLKRIQFADEVSTREEGLAEGDEPNIPTGKASCGTSSKSSLKEGNNKPTTTTSGDDDHADLSPSKHSTSANPCEVSLSEDEADKTMPEDYVEVKHPCGTVTRITKDGKLTRHIMVNGDVMDQFEDCSVRYYYSGLGFSQTTYPNGDEVIEYDSGVLETSRPDGSKIYTYSDGLVRIVDTTGNEEIYFTDGSVMKKQANGECIITWASGQKEIRTASFVKRVYTNGTVKTMYADGSEETRYFNGRIRRKDKNGVLVDDTKGKVKSKKHAESGRASPENQN